MHLRIIIAADADEYSCTCARQAIHSLAAVLQRFPTHFEKQPLLRIHAHGFARRDSEEAWIELIDVADESAVTGVGLAGRVGVRVVELVNIPAVAWDFGDAIDPV